MTSKRFLFSMYKIARFGFCDIQNNQLEGLGKGLAWLITHTKILIILDSNSSVINELGE